MTYQIGTLGITVGGIVIFITDNSSSDWYTTNKYSRPLNHIFENGHLFIYRFTLLTDIFV